MARKDGETYEVRTLQLLPGNDWVVFFASDNEPTFYQEAVIAWASIRVTAYFEGVGFETWDEVRPVTWGPYGAEMLAGLRPEDCEAKIIDAYPRAEIDQRVLHEMQQRADKHYSEMRPRQRIGD